MAKCAVVVSVSAMFTQNNELHERFTKLKMLNIIGKETVTKWKRNGRNGKELLVKEMEKKRKRTGKETQGKW